jgi:hypothetical protein
MQQWRLTIKMAVVMKHGKTASLLAEKDFRIIELETQVKEILEALKRVVAISDRKHDAWDEAKAAIAKAEGK